jgi:hypothetical protein
MARKRRFRFGLPIVFAGRPSVGGVGPGCQPVRLAAVANFRRARQSDSKSPQRVFRCGPNCYDDENISVSCPTCQLFDGQIAERRERLNRRHFCRNCRPPAAVSPFARPAHSLKAAAITSCMRP